MSVGCAVSITRICCGLRPITLSPLRSTYAAPIVLVTFNACLPTLCRAQPLLAGSLFLEFHNFTIDLSTNTNYQLLIISIGIVWWENMAFV